jgi:succinate dehydrogenase/fumarate reductase flavoprotein subunit
LEAWDIIVLGDGPAALRSAAEAAKQGATTLVLSVNALGSESHLAQDGIAAPLQESNNRNHREDTIRAGAFLNDQDIVASRSTDAGRQVDLLERWGVNFRRDSHGIPLVRKAPGHGMARNADAGDATGREIQQTLEEQCMRHGVIRRGDHLPLSLIHTNQSVSGITVVDLVNGRIAALQAKAIILADGGFEGAFSHGAVGLGLDLAFRAGVPLRDLEFIAHTPLGIKDTNMVLPLGLLHDGATLHEANGTDLEIGEGGLDALCQSVSKAFQPVLDARNMNESSKWWKAVFRSVQQRTGVDLSRQTIAIEVRPHSTIGGVSVDEFGRAILSTWSRWFTGLYAAGDASCSGFHGADILPGNQMLDSLLGGAAAGTHAGDWVKNRRFSNPQAAHDAELSAQADHAAVSEFSEEGVVRVGHVVSKVRDTVQNALGFSRNAAGLESAIESLESASILAESIHADQSSLIANTNLVEIARAQASVRLILATAQAALARNESRGCHHRDDFTDSNEQHLVHYTVNQLGDVKTLALRKSKTGNWILPPQ